MDGPLPRMVELGVAAFAGAQATRASISTLRKQLTSEYSIPVGLLKYAEEQTIVSLTAVLKASADFGLKDQAFTNWGVVSGPSLVGREQMAKALDKFHQQGALGASPIVPAYLSLHAVSGTISLALRVHGPNLGVGGSKGSTMEALLTGLAMQQEQSLPGVWVTASEWDPEPIPDCAGQQPEPICRAVSLALTPAANSSALKLRLVANGNNQDCPAATVADLAEFLASQAAENLSQEWSRPLAGHGRLELTSSVVAKTLARSPRAA